MGKEAVDERGFTGKLVADWEPPIEGNVAKVLGEAGRRWSGGQRASWP